MEESNLSNGCHENDDKERGEENICKNENGNGNESRKSNKKKEEIDINVSKGVISYK